MGCRELMPIERIGIAAGILAVVITAGFIYGAITVLTDETWPDW